MTKETPPTYLFTTCTDELVPVKNSIQFAEALDKNGVLFEFHVFPDGPHGLSLAKPDTSDGKPQFVNLRVQQWFEESCSFLNSVWGDFATDNDAPGLGMDRHTVGINMPLGILIEQEGCKEILEQYIPGIEQMLSQNPSAGLYSLKVMNQFSPEVINDELLASLEAALK